tara:strand:- start:9 stop:482 length:474 start_codon:yes stop_codon:yes gene_type:complete
MLFKQNKNILCIIIIVICICIFVPHYDTQGNLCFFGNFYSKTYANIFLEKMKKITTDKEMILNTINKLENDTKICYQKNRNILNENKLYKKEIDKLKIDIQTLQFKIKQQHEFYEIQEKQKEEKKKTDFARVSKKTINLKRPEIGNMFSKSLKKTKK